jgi:hypothetical protein
MIRPDGRLLPPEALPPAASTAAAASTSPPRTRGRLTATTLHRRSAATSWAYVPPGHTASELITTSRRIDRLRPSAAGMATAATTPAACKTAPHSSAATSTSRSAVCPTRSSQSCSWGATLITHRSVPASRRSTRRCQLRHLERQQPVG